MGLCHDNFLEDIDVSNHELDYLWLYNNWFPPMDISKFSHLTKLKGFGVGLHFPNDDTDEETEERLCRYSEYNRWY